MGGDETSLPARLSMKITFSPNVLLLPNRRIRTINTRFSFLASSGCDRSCAAWPWIFAVDPDRARLGSAGRFSVDPDAGAGVGVGVGDRVSIEAKRVAFGSAAGSYVGPGVAPLTDNDGIGCDDALEGREETINCSFNAT